MDKIYSRKRLLIPKIKIGKVKSGIKWKKTNYSDADNNKIFKDKKFEKIVNRKLIKTAIIVFIAICIANRIIATIEPTMDVLCVDMAKSIATKISNEQATIVMR